MINRSSKSGNKSRLNRKDKSSGETSTTREGNGGRLNRKDKSIDETPANRAGKVSFLNILLAYFFLYWELYITYIFIIILV